ncbi:MAG: hypothetical protein DMF63_01145 [Acidobacteria bacterium]|nr:MAG: hypothetical protein DMF63_01145 [Acidobacteriota bacterium]
MQNMIVRFDDLDGKVDDLATDMKEVKTGLVRVEGKVDLLGGQFQDVAGQAMKDTQRITSLEGRVDILESKAN